MAHTDRLVAGIDRFEHTGYLVEDIGRSEDTDHPVEDIGYSEDIDQCRGTCHLGAAHVALFYEDLFRTRQTDRWVIDMDLVVEELCHLADMDSTVAEIYLAAAD